MRTKASAGSDPYADPYPDGIRGNTMDNVDADKAVLPAIWHKVTHHGH